jgi:hypothetical protein
MTFSITTLSTITLILTLKSSWHLAQWHPILSVIMLNVIYAECHYDECRYAESCGATYFCSMTTKTFYNIDERLWLTSWSKNIWTQQKFANCSLSVLKSFLPYLDLIKNIFDQINLILISCRVSLMWLVPWLTKKLSSFTKWDEISVRLNRQSVIVKMSYKILH